MKEWNIHTCMSMASETEVVFGVMVRCGSVEGGDIILNLITVFKKMSDSYVISVKGFKWCYCP